MRRFNARSLFVSPLAALAFGWAALPVAADPPKAPVHDVTDTYFGVPVHDPYRYMEDLKSPDVRSWILAQGAYTDSAIAKIPARDSLLARIEQLDAGRPYRLRGIDRLPDGRMFYLKLGATENVAKLCLRDAAGGERVLVDPATIQPADGGHVSISFYVPTRDGKRVVYGLAASGSEQDVLHVLDVATAKDLPDQIDRMEDGYTPPLWIADDSGFFYSRRQKLAPDAPSTDGYKRSRAYFHALGTNPDNDPVVFANGLWPEVAIADVDFPSIVVLPGSPYAIGKIKHGDANQLTLYAAKLTSPADLAPAAGHASPWKRICDVPDSVTDFAVHGDQIYLMTSRHAPRFQVVRTSLAAPDFAHAAVAVPPGPRVIQEILPAKDALYVSLRNVGALEVSRLAYADGAKLEDLTLPTGYPSGRMEAIEGDVDGCFATTTSWTRAGATYAYDPAAHAFADTHLTPTGPFDELTGCESVEVEVPSWDGVKVPLSIVYKTGTKLDGTHPTLLTGYGAYGLSSNVGYQPTLLAWLERGGVYAVAHVRGGGEYGEEWHLAGQKLTKPNTWKDLIACGQYLVAKGYTRPEHLACEGGSAGGITVGRALTERPDLFGAVLIDVGATSAERMEFTMNGVPNIPEFGTVTQPEGFKALMEMSAYQHVQDGVKYPAVMLSHGLNDPRVEPWESAKMTARLQAATTSGKPVLLRVDTHAGHGIGSTKAQSLKGEADRYAFLLWQLGQVKPLP